jgi:cyanophycin synthetase
MKQTLARRGLSWRSVPADDQQVVLKRVVHDNMADENVSVVGQTAERIIAPGRRATELIGVKLAGIDIIAPDIRLGLAEAGGTTLEVNITPAFHYHYFKQDGASRECPF